MKKVKYIEEEMGEITLNLKNGTKTKMASKTIYTHYDDGTNDCKIIIEKPLRISGIAEEVK